MFRAIQKKGRYPLGNNNKIAKIAEEESTAKLVYAEQEKAVLKKLLTEVTQLADAAEKRIQSRK